MKTTIVMTYFERQHQLTRTLLSMNKSICKNFDVVIVDDNSPNDIVLPDVTFPVYIHKLNQHLWTNPEPVYNTGIMHAIRRGADRLIIQNAECYHVGDVIDFASRANRRDYISFACFSINERNTFSDHDIHELIRSNNFGAGHDGQNAWYNHSVHRPVGYDFCATMDVVTMFRLNGFDERFSYGMGYGDDNILNRVKRMTDVNFRIVDDPFVVHQWHYNGLGVPENKPDLITRNRQLFNELKNDPSIRAKHIFTPDLDNLIVNQILNES